MENNLLTFRQRQSAKLRAYAQETTDPALKEEFLQMSASWLAPIENIAQFKIEKSIPLHNPRAPARVIEMKNPASGKRSFPART
jgi:hypothetical protein